MNKYKSFLLNIYYVLELDKMFLVFENIDSLFNFNVEYKIL